MTSTQIDSDANMLVLGQHATINNRSGKSDDKRPLTSSCYKLKSVPIVDVVVAYDFPHTFETFILVVRNGLYVHLIMNILIPPFVMREAVLKVYCILSIHIERQNLTNESHCIVSTVDGTGTELQITMQLYGIFSYFPT